MSEDNKDKCKGLLLGTISLMLAIGGDYFRQNMEEFDIEGEVEKEAPKGADNG